MILEGLKLVLIGMVIVFVFLLLLMVCMIAASRLLRQDIQVEKATPTVMARESKPEERLVAVLSAAVAAYRAKRGK